LSIVYSSKLLFWADVAPPIKSGAVIIDFFHIG
jgi:hypothetical protein